MQHRVIWLIVVMVTAMLAAWPLAAREAAESTPQQAFVSEVVEDVLASIRQDGGNGTAGKLEDVFNRYVDINWVGRFVLGRHWREATDVQRSHFSSNYRDFMVASYTKRLQTYAGEKYTISEPRDLGKGRSALTMEIAQNSGQPIVIEYKIRETEGGGYKVYDLVVEGVSLITTQRSEFDSIVTRKGLDFLINALGKKASKSA